MTVRMEALTKCEVAEELRVSQRTVERWLRLGLLRRFKGPGGRRGVVRVSRKALDDFIKDREKVRP